MRQQSTRPAAKAARDSASVTGREYPITPDGRYFLVAGRLWRSKNPAIPREFRHRLVAELMDARRAVKDAKRGNCNLAAARARVDAAKVALGERGPIWWNDGSPDLNRHMAKDTPYAGWGGRSEEMGQRAVLGFAPRPGIRTMPYQVDLSLDPGTLNERLLELGFWLNKRSISHLARILMEPEHERLRVSFPDPEDAKAFQDHFCSTSN